jgi:hypothetical protein
MILTAMKRNAAQQLTLARAGIRDFITAAHMYAAARIMLMTAIMTGHTKHAEAVIALLNQATQLLKILHLRAEVQNLLSYGN